MNDQGICDIHKLVDLLKPEKESSDSDDDLPVSSFAKLGPGHIGPKASIKGKESFFKVKTCSGASTEDTPDGDGVHQNDDDDIWREDEIVTTAVGDDRLDPRECPEYDIKYRQAVTAEDVFLQMGGKTAATASCEDMVITIHLEGERKAAVDLNVTRTTLDIRSPLYRLQLHLPHAVDPNTGNALWNDKTQSLVVTLRMNREYDFINF